jgi:hypothetical protein
MKTGAAETGVAGVTGVQELQNVELSGVKEDSWLESNTNGRNPPSSTRISADPFCNS